MLLLSEGAITISGVIPASTSHLQFRHLYLENSKIRKKWRRRRVQTTWLVWPGKNKKDYPFMANSSKNKNRSGELGCGLFNIVMVDQGKAHEEWAPVRWSILWLQCHIRTSMPKPSSGTKLRFGLSLKTKWLNSCFRDLCKPLPFSLSTLKKV